MVVLHKWDHKILNWNNDGKQSNGRELIVLLV